MTLESHRMVLNDVLHQVYLQLLGSINIHSHTVHKKNMQPNQWIKLSYKIKTCLVVTSSKEEVLLGCCRVIRPVRTQSDSVVVSHLLVTWHLHRRSLPSQMCPTYCGKKNKCMNVRDSELSTLKVKSPAGGVVNISIKWKLNEPSRVLAAFECFHATSGRRSQTVKAPKQHTVVYFCT